MQNFNSSIILTIVDKLPDIMLNIVYKLPDQSKFKFGFSNKQIFMIVNFYFQQEFPVFKYNLKFSRYFQIPPFYYAISKFRNTCFHCKNKNISFIDSFNVCEHCFYHNIHYFKINKQQLQKILKSNTSDFLSQYDDWNIQSSISPQNKKYLMKSVQNYSLRIQDDSAIQLIENMRSQRIVDFQNKQKEQFCVQLIDDLSLDPVDNQRIRSLPLFIQFFQYKNYSLISQIQQQLSFISNYQSLLSKNVSEVLSQFPQFSISINYSLNQQIIDTLLSLYNIYLHNQSTVYNDVFSNFSKKKKQYPFVLMDLVQNLHERFILNQIDKYPDIQQSVSQMINFNFHYINQNYQKQFIIAAQFIGFQTSHLQNQCAFMAQLVSLFFWFETKQYDISQFPPRIYILYMYYIEYQSKY